MEDTQIGTTQTIAVVDDDESVRAALKSLLRSSGYDVRTYCSALDFLDTAGPPGRTAWSPTSRCRA